MSIAPADRRTGLIETARHLAPRLTRTGDDWDRAAARTLSEVIEDETHFDDEDAACCLTELQSRVRGREGHRHESEVTEHQVAVVFDVRACSRDEAAAAVCDALAMYPGSRFQELLQIGTRDGGAGEVEAWWLPEADVKHVDGNDRDAYHLVPVTDLDCTACDAEPGEPCRSDCTGTPLT